MVRPGSIPTRQPLSETGKGNRAVLGFCRTAETMQGTVRRLIAFLGFFLFGAIVTTPAWGELPAPSVHWGSVAFPNQYSKVITRLTLNRFRLKAGLRNQL